MGIVNKKDFSCIRCDEEVQAEVLSDKIMESCEEVKHAHLHPLSYFNGAPFYLCESCKQVVVHRFVENYFTNDIFKVETKA